MGQIKGLVRPLPSFHPFVLVFFEKSMRPLNGLLKPLYLCLFCFEEEVADQILCKQRVVSHIREVEFES